MGGMEHYLRSHLMLSHRCKMPAALANLLIVDDDATLRCKPAGVYLGTELSRSGTQYARLSGVP